MSYHIVIHSKALREIQKLPNSIMQRVEDKIDKLANNPRPKGYKKMTNYSSDRVPGQDCCRIRVGDYRVIYTIKDQTVTVVIAQVKKRGDIY